MAVLALFPRRRTWFVGVAAPVVLSSGAIFAALGLLDFSSWRAEATGWLLKELPFVFVLSSVCLAQAGLLPARLRVVGLQEAISRPRLRTALGWAPAVLFGAWIAAFIVGMGWPLPVLQVYAPVPPHYLLLKGFLILPEALYSGLAGWLFFKSARQRTSAPRLRLKNICYSFGTFCWFLMALQIAVHAVARVWFPADLLENTTETVLRTEGLLLAASTMAYGLGLAMHYAPAFNRRLATNEYPQLLHAVNRFEGARWHLVQGGKVRGLITVSYHVRVAAGRLDLTEEDLQRCLKTLQLVAILRDEAGLGGRTITAEDARRMNRLQKEIMRDPDLASRVSLEYCGADTVSGREIAEDEPFNGPVEGALYLLEEDRPKDQNIICAPPVWYHLAAAGAVASGLLEETSTLRKLGNATDYAKARTAYINAKNEASVSTAN